MAEVVEGKCECGYQSPELLTGATMSGDSYSICACYDCGNIKSLKWEDAQNAFCNSCQNALTRIDFYKNDYFRCPRCGDNKMWLMTVMMAD